MRIEYIFEIHKGKSKKQPWYWRCKASNGEIRCHSENYHRKAGAVNAVREWVKKMKPGCARVDESWRDKGASKRKTV